MYDKITIRDAEPHDLHDADATVRLAFVSGSISSETVVYLDRARLTELFFDIAEYQAGRKEAVRD